MEETKECCCERKTIRREELYKSLKNRLNRIEGQIRGIQKMLDEEAYCPDILIQVSAVNSALNSFSKELLSEHIRHCVLHDIKDGKEET
ncbi:MAG: metal-sensing transcriptional repressor, partial [Erysipelotrichales bacterium]|nr:metal-sensing transcriptional repressor [Erysipelotrichales bacterium]